MNNNISLEEEHNLQLGDQSLEIKIDTTDKLGFIVDSMPHLVRHAHKCVQNSPSGDYSCERELVRKYGNEAGYMAQPSKCFDCEREMGMKKPF